MSQTSVMYHKARHINTRVYHLLQLCKDRVLVLEKVSSAEQVADSLTKSTPKLAFKKHCDAMLGAQAMSKTNKTTNVVDYWAELRPDFASEVDEMEGIEQPELMSGTKLNLAWQQSTWTHTMTRSRSPRLAGALVAT
eukprot:3213927-Rhodomonas_salina.1